MHHGRDHVAVKLEHGDDHGYDYGKMQEMPEEMMQEDMMPSEDKMGALIEKFVLL